MEFLIGLDIGTSAAKGILIDKAGRLKGETSSNYSVSNPQAGWSEQDPEDWWQATLEVLKKLQSIVTENNGEIAGISFSGQMHSSVFLDKDDEVIRPAILWSDTRTSAECQEIEELAGGREKLIEMTGNKALEGFTAPKVLWLKNNEPENYDKVESLLLPKDYIRYRLTGKKAMDLSDAAGTLMLNVKKGEWHVELLEKLGINPDILPPLLNSTEVAGEINSQSAELTGIPEGTTVVAGGADNACGAAGSGMVEEGQVMVSIGSSGVILAPADKYQAVSGGKLHLFNHSAAGKYYYMGVMLAAGQALSWYMDNVLPEGWDYKKLNAETAEIPAGSENLIFLPYLNGERTPHADANARAVFFGLSALHNKAHMARAVMEGVTFGLRDSLELIQDNGIDVKTVRAIGGGAKSKVWQQIIADIFNKPVELLEIEEGPAYGAALIAGVGAGIYNSLEEANQELIKVKEVIQPDPEKAKKYNELYHIYRGLYPALKESYKSLNV
ncbi:MAG: xylulokinase [Bacillota bacterium]